MSTKKPVTKENLAKLKSSFDAYSKYEKAVNDAKEALEKATAARSASIQAIFEIGGAGPFKFDGRFLKVVKRENRAEPTDQQKKDGKPGDLISTNYFFRGNSDDVQEIG